MTILQGALQCDQVETIPRDGAARGISYEGELTVRICNEAAEHGCKQEPGPLTWLKSARITTDPENDSIHLNVSVGDPRGGFRFKISRRPDTGAILIHMPFPGEPLPHMDTKEVAPGTLVVVGHAGGDKPLDFSDVEPDDLEGGAV